MNNLFQQLNQQGQSLSGINSGNLNNFNMNPQLQMIINMVKNSGKTPKELFYQLAQQRGVDPNSILQMFK